MFKRVKGGHMTDPELTDPLLGGRVQVYTGNGKGKTTAALGLALRFACSGQRVYIGQFMKGSDYSELCLPSHFPGLITMEQYGTPRLLCQGEKPSDEDIARARKGSLLLREAVSGGSYGLVIADELNVTVHLGLLSIGDALGVIADRAQGVELVLTGRYAPKEIIDAADLVTEMNEVRHYYTTEKLKARKGIEY
jgi:cob(I)alamin adenosyltransferase